ncbi:MAG: zinc-dependent metalloprotease [Galactobacter sp.]
MTTDATSPSTHSSDRTAKPTSVVRWGVAVSTAKTLASAGPKASTTAAIGIVEDIREHARAAEQHVENITGLHVASSLKDSQVLVVDRPGWAAASVSGYREMLGTPLDAALLQRFPKGLPLTLKMGGYGVGAEVGSLVAFLASHVLGQFDPYSTTASAPAGRLLLVAPNIVETERKLKVDPADFRLWVALHEQTHRVQFAAAPWLRDVLSEQVGILASGLVNRPKDKERKDSTLKARISALGSAARADNAASMSDDDGPASADTVPSSPSAAKDGKEGQAGLLTVITGEAEQAALSRITAIMSLLEGHANVVMDSVDRTVIPTVAKIRKRFDQRGASRSTLQKLLMKAIGMDAKQAQYRDGAKFVRAAVDALGMEGFNVIWRSPEHLPIERELHAPETWVQRMRETALVGAPVESAETAQADAASEPGAAPSGTEEPTPEQG